jgi:quercetin dioxygenase-like cupin family protein
MASIIGAIMPDKFPPPIKNLPEAYIPLDGVTAFLSQSDDHQIVFIYFEKDTDVPEHSHASQWEIVIEGKVDLLMNGKYQIYKKGEHFFIPGGIKHSAKVYAGYHAVIFFAEKNRYKKK